MEPNYQPPQPMTPPSPVTPPAPPVQPVVPPRVTPSAPPTPPTKTPDSSNVSNKIYIVLSIIILLAVVLWVLDAMKTEPQPKSFTSEKVEVVNSGAKVPEGFPTFLSVEEAGLVEANKIDYVERKVILYSLTFNSAKQAEELYAGYKEALKKAEFTVASESKQSSQLFVQANGVKDSVSVVVRPMQAGAQVQIAYTEKK